ncbi:Proteasome subunit beta type-4 [Trichoplax sp. H2]|nr:Proteasome subunit beta type-4 [Trichoplax sp. H2]|eukprot:RDD40828.1 Proteasome subunit beta type-4 [Trichoplax sp. H2]
MADGGQFSAAPFWQNGPSPGQFYNTPGTNLASSQLPRTYTQQPIVTGTSVLGVTFTGGVVIAADTLGSYGSLARFRDISRLLKVNEKVAIGASGDYADFQFIRDIINQKVLDGKCLNDNYCYSPVAIHTWLTRILYNRRTKINPLWNNIIVGGYDENEGSYLGYVDKLGVAYQAPTIATGYGSYIAQPLLRQSYESNNNSFTEEQALSAIERCMRVLLYRDGRSGNQYEVAIITKDGCQVTSPKPISTNWDIAEYVKYGICINDSIPSVANMVLSLFPLAFCHEVNGY